MPGYLLQCSEFLRLDQTSSRRYAAPSESAPVRSIEVSAALVNVPAAYAAHEDSTSVVVVNPRVLVGLGVFDGCYALIESVPAGAAHFIRQPRGSHGSDSSQTLSESTITRLVKLRTQRCGDVLDDGERHKSRKSPHPLVFVTPILGFNLRLKYEGFEARRVRIRTVPEGSALDMEEGTSATEPDKHLETDSDEAGGDVAPSTTSDVPQSSRCTQLNIRQLITSPRPPVKRVDAALRQFFKVPRLLHEGDLFHVSVTVSSDPCKYSYQLHRLTDAHQQFDNDSSSNDDESDDGMDSDSDGSDSECVDTSSGEGHAVATNSSRGHSLLQLTKRIRATRQLVYFSVSRVSKAPQSNAPSFAEPFPTEWAWAHRDWTRLQFEGVQNDRFPPRQFLIDMSRGVSSRHKETGGVREIAAVEFRQSEARALGTMTRQLRRLLRPAFDPHGFGLRRAAPVLLFGVS